MSFRCLHGPPASRRPAPVFAGGTPAVHNAPSFHSAWPLAERYEALIRVFNDPAPYARRLARRLHATPHRVREVSVFPEGARNLVGRQSAATTDAPVESASRCFDSS